MKNIIVGTAGHVDHGKTCLIKALTGTDTDRLKEEKTRGITIENGFAEMTLQDCHLGIIDVPGHEKFIKNMLAGIGGIDLVLLVIGLDEGVMPQTREHFEILKMLHIHDGIIVLTKDDLVEDEEWKTLVEEDARDLVQGSFLEDAPMLRVSAATGEHIEELRNLILQRAGSVGRRSTEKNLFRLPIDRVFTIDGFGTVITGTLLEGCVSPGDEVEVYPEGGRIKVRNVQVHGKNVDMALAGQRTALNLAGVKKENLRRGEILAWPGSLISSLMVDVRLEMFSETERAVLDGSRVHFYCGSEEVLAKVVLLDREALAKGETGYAQLRLENPVAVKRGDRFIIRFYSPMESIGGGVVLDAAPQKHKRNRPEVIHALTVKDCGSPEEVAALTIAEASEGYLAVTALAAKLLLSAQETDSLLATLQSEGKIRFLTEDLLMHQSQVERIAEKANFILQKYHEENELSPGMSKEEFKSRLGRELRQENPRTLEAILQLLMKETRVETAGKLIRQAGFQVKRTPAMEALAERIMAVYLTAGYEMPTVEEVVAGEKDKNNTRHMIEALADEGKLSRINFKYFIPAALYDQAKQIVIEKINSNGEITLAEFRDAIGSSRKYAVELLEHFDEIRFTMKNGDVRVLWNSNK